MAIVTGSDVAAALSLPETPEMQDVADVADEIVSAYLTQAAIDTPPTPVREAGLVVAIDVLQNRTAVGGQPVGIDFQPSPYRMGKTLLDRVTGLIGPWMDQAGDVT